MSDPSSGPDLLNDLAHEFAERYRHGERPSLTEYAERHPELADQIRELFPTLAVMEEFGSVGGANSEPAANSKHVPERLGEYRILREVGRGGMGVVYEAVQESLGRHVALKVLPMRGAVPEKQRERFKREAKAAANLHHTNIVPVFGVGEAEGVHFYAMQFIHGQGLDAVLEEVRRLRAGTAGPPPDANANLTASLAAGLVSGFDVVRPSAVTDPAILTRNTHAGSTSAVVGKSGESATGSDYYRRVAQIGLQVAEALVHAHAQGVLHRDVKPSNLLLDARGCVWVTDFGLAKMEGSEELTTPGDIVGTLRYMPPERFAGQEDARGDVYGLGLTLYEMLALRPAFDAPDRPRLLDQVRHGDVPNPRQSDPRVPRDLETVVLKAAARDPRDRYQTPAELAADLGRFLADRPVHARRVSWVEQARRWCRRNRAVSLLGAGILCSLVLAVILQAIGNARLRDQKDKTDDALKTANDNYTEAKIQERFAKENAKLASEKEKLANEKSKLANVQKLLAGRRFHNAQIYLANLAAEIGDTPRALDLLETLRPKPDEDDLRTFEWYYLWQRCNHSLRLTIRGHEAAVKSVQVSPDGKTIASAGADGTLRLWSLATGKQSAVFRGSSSRHSRLAFSPDGRTLALLAHDGTLKLWDMTTGQELASAKTDSGDWVDLAWSPDGKVLASISNHSPGVTLWDVTGGLKQRLAQLPAYPATCLAFSPDGKTVAVGTQHANLFRFDTATRQKKFHLTQIDPGDPAVEAVAFSSDGKTLATVVGTGIVKLWESDTLLLRTSLKAHTERTRGLAISPDGQSLATASHDGTVKLWDTVTGQERLSFKPRVPPKSSVTHFVVAFSPDGNTLAVGCGWVLLLRAATNAEARGRKIHTDPDDPDNPLALNTRGDHLWKAGSVAEAEASYRRALALLERATREYPDPDQARHELMRGACTLSALLSDTKREHEAEPIRRQAREVARQLPPEARVAAAERLYAAGESLRLGGLAAAAENAYSLVTTIEPGQARLWPVRGRAFFALGRYEKAAAEWSPLLDDPWATPDLIQPLLIAQYRIGDYQAVIETANKVNRRGIANDDFNPLVLALAHARRGDQALARKWYLIGLMHLYRMHLYRVHLHPREASPDQELTSLRAEASRLLDLPEQLTPEEQQVAAVDRRYLTLVIEADPEVVWAYCQRAFYFVTRNEDNAIADCSKAIALLPNNPLLRHRRAQMYRRAKKWDLAVADYTRAVELNPKDSNTWNERGIAYFDGFGNAEAAIRDYSEAIELAPRVADYWSNRGTARNRLGHWAEAVADFGKAIELDPNKVRPWSGRGYSHLQLGRYDRAVADYTQAIKLDPKQDRFWHNRGVAHYRLGEYDTARADFTEAVVLDPKNAAALVDRASVHALLGLQKEARADLDSALEVAAPAYAATVHQTLADFLNDEFGPEHRDPKGAMEAANKALAIAPKNGVAWSSLGRAQYHAGEYRSALESLTKATDLRTDKGPHLVFRAMVHWKLGQRAEAHRWYSEWAGRLEQTRATWEGNRPLAEITDRYRAEAVALWGGAIPDVAPLPRAVPSPK
jgi:serine/threonine protein kinase/tetratricopeptide (TPR) repeat protein